jgi:hypothetical protein
VQKKKKNRYILHIIGTQADTLLTTQLASYIHTRGGSKDKKNMCELHTKYADLQ